MEKSTNVIPLLVVGVESREMEAEMVEDGTVLHMFIHFTLGNPFDTISPEIFVFNISEEHRRLVYSINEQLIDGKVK